MTGRAAALSAREQIRQDAASWQAVVGALRGSGRRPLSSWRCSGGAAGRGGCLLHAIYQAPDGRKVIDVPGRSRHSPAVSEQLGLSPSTGYAADLAQFFAANTTGLHAVVCKHFVVYEIPVALIAEDLGMLRHRLIPDEDTPGNIVTEVNSPLA